MKYGFIGCGNMGGAIARAVSGRARLPGAVMDCVIAAFEKNQKLGK